MSNGENDTNSRSHSQHQGQGAAVAAGNAIGTVGARNRPRIPPDQDDNVEQCK